MMIHGEIDNEFDAIETARENDLFDDETDAEYAMAEEATDYDIEHFTKHNMVTEV